MNILILDDEPECCTALEFFLSALGSHTLYTAEDAVTALGILREKPIDVIFCDVGLPVIDGIEFTRLAKYRKKEVNIVLISGRQDIVQSINALEHGAFDFIAKPADGAKIAAILRRIELRAAKKTGARQDKIDPAGMPPHALLYLDDLARQYPVCQYPGLEGAGFFSPAVEQICRKLEKLALYPDIPVLLEGRTGTGKELFAHYLHYLSPRAGGPFIALNCAAIPGELFEAELFGYAGGAFTDADAQGKEGKFKIAEGGTLFLDEISEIPLSCQSKLLRVLQEREYYPVGGREKQMVNTGIVCASNKRLASLVKMGVFREDLYYRLNACRIGIPPLRKRRQEILPLSVLFLQELNKKNSIPVKGLEAGFLKQLMEYHWPGNIRELKNLLMKASLFNDSEILRADSLTLQQAMKRRTGRVLNTNSFSLPEDSLDLEQLIRKIIVKALGKFGGNKTKTAAYLKIPRKKLYHRYNRCDE